MKAMEYMSSAILSGVLYDMIKLEVSITADNLKEKLKGWVVDELIAPVISKELADLNLNDELSEKAIEKRINETPKLLDLLSSIRKETSVTTIVQNHSGTGDNIGRDKITK